MLQFIQTIRQALRIRKRNKSFVRFCKANKWAPAAFARNKALKQSRTGKRCFILGNGPSLKTEDLNQLAGEDVFTVNQAARHPLFPVLKSKVHLWADPNFFVLDENNPGDKELIDSMRNINTENNTPICFFPAAQHDFVLKHKLDQVLDVRYFYSSTEFNQKWVGEFDFTQDAPGFNAVVMWGVALAIYMGYSEIYLLGVDTTSILVNIKSVLKQNDDDDYSYKVSENEKRRLEQMIERQGLETQAASFLASLTQYRNLYNFCTARNIKLINCSSTTLIDSIPRRRLVDVL